jgi:putative transposase
VDRWFGNITQRVIRRGSFSSIKEQIAKIEHIVTTGKKTKARFIWLATADSILENCRIIAHKSPGRHSRKLRNNCLHARAFPS